MRRLAVLALLALPVLGAPAPAPRPYHLTLEADPAAPFPFLSRFGRATLHVYRSGVRAETLWLNGFSRAGSPNITVENPFGRMYTEVPVTNVGSIVAKLAGSDLQNANPTLGTPMDGRVGELTATRYRLIYGPEAYIDIWSTHAIPENKQFRSIVVQFVGGISPGTATLAKTIPGTPIYVEMNFRRFKKLPLLRLRSLTYDDNGEAAALKVSSLMVHASVLDNLWK
ncbi:MAG TPA: hypothetical protein VF381_09090 [Thermoanaerobaculia bacterium]